MQQFEYTLYFINKIIEISNLIIIFLTATKKSKHNF